MPTTKPTNFKHYILFLGSILFIFSACDSKRLSKTHVSTAEQDSIRLWLNQARKTKITKTKSYLLKKAYEKTITISDDSLKSKYLAMLSLNFLRLPDSTLFRNINNTAIKVATKAKDSTSLAGAYWDLGDFFRRKSVLDSAYINFDHSEKIFTALGNGFSSGRLLYSMANIQSLVGDYTGAETNTIKAIEKLKPLNKNVNLYYCYDLLADLSKLLNEYDRALEYYQESLIYFEKSNMPLIKQQNSKNNIGLVYQKLGQHQKAIEYFSEVLNHDSLGYKNPRLYARALNNLGSSYLKQDSLQQLPELFYKALVIQDSIHDLGGKAASTYRLAEYYLAKKDTATAFDYLSESKKLANQSIDNKRLLEILRLFPKVDPANATKHTQDYITLSDRLQHQERKIRNKFARIQFETDEFIAENQLLARQKQLWTGITIVIMLLGIATFIIVSQRIKNRMLRFKQKQQASNQEIFNLLLAQNEKVEEGKKLEQKRVSEELHDGVLGKMLGARMMLLGLNKKNTPEAINERARAISILQSIEGEIRSISHELNHAAYQKIHNFILSIEDLLRTTESASGIKINFTYAENIDWDALKGDIKINLYRIIQESIQNAVKHAACNEINLDFKVDAEFLKITIADDGKGFETKREKKGIGMKNIASRIEKINGNWHLKSHVKKGTTVSLVIPIVNHKKS